MKKDMLIEYYSNNSGGGDWLSEEDWNTLKSSGWKLFSHGEFVYNNDGSWLRDKEGFPTKKSNGDTPHYAFKKFKSIEKAIEEFESLTGQDAYDEGCDCCGQPHNFSIAD